MKQKAVIFDFNGTMLFDTMFQYDAWNRVLADCGREPIDEEEYRNVLCGRNSRETVEYLWGPGLSEYRTRYYCNTKKAIYQKLCLDDPEHFKLVPGLPKYLDALKELGIPFTIATSSSPYSVDFYYRNLGLDRWFDRDDIICNDRIKNGKPAPDLFLAAAKELGVPPKDCLVFEDANAGVRAANAAGIGAVIVLDPENRFLPEDDLQFDGIYPNFRAVFVENTVDCPQNISQ